MKIRLQEIEFGAQDTKVSQNFYRSILRLDTAVDQDGLKVFKSGVDGLDFNISTHLPVRTMVTSFLTDDLQAVMDSLHANGVSFEGPRDWHFEMRNIEFKDPDGYLVRVNQPTDASPPWLKV
jgi:catechol 2,3-dioxygenase-like lactoylglutathione lyase family enzyme